ncbi:hypothetical protein KPG71_17045 [Roseovarius sp. PS-C2]|uniref:hypothetical protein n=1 Tax=Roseovarius sp. PS-C2 TaxID=2820814 RepID=UPI001C0B7BEF|nr:hypothetical protein [Roseovarius sp. PS-C2]MBU3261736.1 hypothetical protein [Roseovarius sp. PS-C2]
MKPVTLLMCSAIAVTAACAKKPETIDAAYVSPTTYQDWNCPQLAAEARRVDNALAKASAAQNKARGNDTAGVILLGLPVSTLSGGNVADQIAQLKGHKQVIEQTQIRKNCMPS